MLTAGAPARARSEVRAGPNANYRLEVMSWAEIPFRSVVRQRYDFSCGSAAVATLLSYHYGRDTPEAPVFRAMWAVGDQPIIRKAGFSMLDIKRYLDAIGYPAEGYRLTLAGLARLGRPGIVLLNLHGYKHFVVVKGVAHDGVLVGDPVLGLTRYSAADFAMAWNGIFLGIVDDHGRPPRFNLASDWGPWSRAPLAGGRSATAIGQLTDYLPPLYQITPISLSNATATPR